MRDRFWEGPLLDLSKKPMKAFAICVLIICVSSPGYAQNWRSFGSGMNGEIDALLEDKQAGRLYAGGMFNSAAGTAANNIAQWDGNSWAALGSGTNSVVNDLALFQDELYAVGSFSSPGNHIAKWNGTSWSGVGGGTNSSSFALQLLGDDLYVGGAFTAAGSVDANYVAKWDGNNWSALGGGTDGVVRALGVYKNELYVGGDFTMADGKTVNHIARWDGAAWQPLGTGLDAAVWAIQEFMGDLYVGGLFNSAGGNTAVRVAKWDGNNWSAVGSSLNNSVFALAEYNGELYAGGFFQMIWATSAPASRIAKWDGNAWSAIGDGLNDGVFALSSTTQALYIGGNFTASGSTTLNNITALGHPVPIDPAFGGRGIMSVSPNPMNTQARIQLDGLPAFSSYKLELIDVHGTCVQQTLHTSAEGLYLQRNHLPSGLYAYRLMGEGHLIGQGKIVMQ